MKKGGGGDPGGSSSSSGIIIIINTTATNSNKRKIHDDILEEGLPVPKHACLDNKNHHHPLSEIHDTTTCLDSVMSLSNDSKHHDNDHDVSSSASVNWSGATTTQDSIYNHRHHHFDYPSPSFDQQPQLDCGDMMMSIPEYYETNHQSQNHGHEDGDGDLMFCSNAAAGEEASSTNYVLSSGRWNIVNNQDTEQITEKLTIDKEFEQYFSMLML